MNDKTLLALLDCDNQHTRDWFHDAVREGWGGLDDVAEAAMEVHGEIRGFLRCRHCNTVILDCAVAAQIGCSGTESEAVGLVGDTILCRECFDKAIKARRKIVIEDDGEGGERDDDSTLTEEEAALASLLEKAIDANCRADRELIGSYPRDERRQLHRYQDDIDADRQRSGKTRG